jgi:biopolymer transport protein ExbD
MFGKHKRRRDAEHIDPDLPITPMLDMTFQLLFFFVMTYRPQTQEQQIAVMLPENPGGGVNVPDPSAPPAPVLLVFEVHEGDNHGLGAISLRIEDKNSPAGKGGKVPITDLNQYSSILAEKKKEYDAAKRDVKVQLEIAPKLAWKNTVLLIDRAKNAGYNDVAPTIMGK